MRKKFKRMLCMVLAFIMLVTGLGNVDVRAAVTTKTFKFGDVEVIEGVKIDVGSVMYMEYGGKVYDDTSGDYYFNSYYIDIDNTSVRIADVSISYIKDNKEKKTKIRLLPGDHRGLIVDSMVSEVGCTVNSLYTADVQEFQTETIKCGKSATVNGVYFEVDLPDVEFSDEEDIGSGVVAMYNTTDKSMRVTLEFFSYKNGKKVKAGDTVECTVKPNWRGSDFMYGKEVKCTVVDIEAAKAGKEKYDTDVKEWLKSPLKKHGEIDGVEYKANEIYQYVRANKTQDKVSIAFKNTNSYPIHISGKVGMYDRNGIEIISDDPKKIVICNTIDLYLYPNQRGVNSLELKDVGSNEYKQFVKDIKLDDIKVKKVSTKEIRKKTKEGAYYPELSNLKVKSFKGKVRKFNKKYYSNDKVMYIKEFGFTAKSGYAKSNIYFNKDVYYNPYSYQGAGYGVMLYFYDKDGYPLGNAWKYMNDRPGVYYKGDHTFLMEKKPKDLDLEDAVTFDIRPLSSGTDPV